MDERIARTLNNINDFEHLAQFEINAGRKNAITDEVAEAIKARSAYLGRKLIAARTGLDLSDLTAAEQRIVEAVSKYVGVMKRKGKDATRTLRQLHNRGLIESAETAVAKARPTQGFQVLKDENLEDLSYEQIILDHPEEFSLRAAWFARRTLGLPNASEKPPAKGVKDETPVITGDAPYWVFVCNPAKWAIDRFLADGIAEDSWGIRPSDQGRFAFGQLGIVRVGVDKRSAAMRGGKPKLESGIYALCEVESAAFPGTGGTDSYWAPSEAREPGWPTVRIRYLRSYLNAPLTIERLRAERPDVSNLLLNGFQAASFPISGDDFRAVLELLNEDAEDLPSPSAPSIDTLERLTDLENKYRNASIEVKARVSKYIERGPIGAEVKKATGYKCQLCDAMGRDPIGFRKKNGDPYVEAHHVMPVSTMQIGALAASNIMTLCANHHRQMHYGGVAVIVSDSAFSVTIDGTVLIVPKAMLPAPKANKREADR
jgi:predicted RNA-binding protein with PUA-like domain